MELLRSIESRSLALRDRVGGEFTHEIDAAAPTIRLPMERPLYIRARSAAVNSAGVEQGRFDGESAALFEQTYVDPAPLIRSVRKALQRRPQIGLPDVVAESPITHGLSELVTYLSLDDEGFTTVFDECARETVGWTDEMVSGATCDVAASHIRAQRIWSRCEHMSTTSSRFPQ